MMQYSYNQIACAPKDFLTACAEHELCGEQVSTYDNLTTKTV